MTYDKGVSVLFVLHAIFCDNWMLCDALLWLVRMLSSKHVVKLPAALLSCVLSVGFRLAPAPSPLPLALDGTEARSPEIHED